MKKINILKQSKVLLIFLSLFFAYRVNAQTIINSSFETPDVTNGNVLPGVSWRPAGTTWVFDGGNNTQGLMKYGCAYAPPLMPDGKQCAGIQDGGYIYQDIEFAAGTYVLSLSAAQRTGNADGNLPVVVSVDGTTISTLTSTTTASFTTLKTTSFTVTAGTHRVKLLTSGSGTIFIDNIIIASPSAYLTGSWDQRPVTTFSTSYNQNFSSLWDTNFNTVFQQQWSTVDAFEAANVSTGALNFNWPARRIMATKALTIPYTFTADIDYQNNSNRGGIVLRVNSSNLDNMQEPAYGDPGFNKEGIAFYPTGDGSSYIVQFNSTASSGYAQAKVFVPAPVSTTLLSRNTIKVEDYGNAIYVFYNGNPYIRIELGEKAGNQYATANVYNATMNLAGVVTGKAIESQGKAGIAQRDASLRLYSAKIEIMNIGTSINNIISNLKVYQSGSSIFVDLAGLSGSKMVSVCDLQGKIIETRTANGGEKISISKVIKSGVYLVKVKDAENTIIRKISVM